MKGVQFVDDTQRTKIQGETTKERFNLVCRKCRIKNGACIQCDFKTCMRSFHVKCAVAAGRIPTSDEIEELFGNIDGDE